MDKVFRQTARCHGAVPRKIARLDVTDITSVCRFFSEFVSETSLDDLSRLQPEFHTAKQVRR
jgi:hypothetical protein